MSACYREKNMSLNVVSGRSLAGIAAACLISVALPTVPAFAQKVKNKPAEQQEATSAPPEVVVSIPTVDAVDSSIDADTIKAILSGALLENVDSLATLDATSITVPEITVSVSSEGKLTFKNLVFDNVVDGVAATASMESSTFTADDGVAELGSTSATNVNLRGLLGVYGLVDGEGSTEMETLYADFVMEGGTITADELNCDIGAISGDEVRGRPIKTSFVEIMAIAQQMEDNPDEVDPAFMGKFISMYADVLTAFESTEFTFDGFSCNGTDDEGRAMTFSIGNMIMAGMSPGIYPQISMDDFVINVEGDGVFTLGNFTMKQFDLSSTIAALEAAPDDVDEAWFDANARSLIPSFEGLSFSGLSVDIPDPDADGERIVADVDDFDLTLGNYVNGIPSLIDTSASGIRATLPADTDDEQLQQLIALGVTDVDAGFRVAAAWDEATDTIGIEEVSFSGVDLATVVLSGTIANATSALFSLDENEALMAGMGVAVKALNLDVTDAGLSDIILAVAAADQGADPATLRPVFAGLAEGTIIGMMAGAADAAKLGTAVNQFVSGAAKSLNIGIEAKDEPGLSMVDFMQAETDPTTLIGKVNISATAK